MKPHTMLKPALLIVGALFHPRFPAAVAQSAGGEIEETKGARIRLTADHMAAVNRQRRIILQSDVGAGAFYNEALGPDRLTDAIDYHLSPLDEPGNQIDSVWWDWTEGNSASWPSKIIPRQTAIFPRWSDAGVDPVKVLLEEARKRGREVFFSYRVNGNDNGPGEYKLVRPIKEKHLDHLIQAIYPFKHYWNFVYPEVREFKRDIVSEIATLYPFDGIQLDFARTSIVFPTGEQWADREHLTAYLRSVRTSLLEIENQRGRPILLAARVPENLISCHYDGYDVETWAREKLVDILVLGNRSAEVDLAAFRRVTAQTGIKLYPSWDDYHASDGYRNAPIEVYRGVASNWWRQGADGIHLFNIGSPSPAVRKRIEATKVEGFSEAYLAQTMALWERQVAIFSEVGSTNTLEHQDTVFVVQRRGDNLGPAAWPKPTEWETPRHMSFGANLLAQLPAPLSSTGTPDTLLVMAVAENMADSVKERRHIALRVVVSERKKDQPDDADRIESTVVGNYTRPGPDPSAMNHPPRKGIEERIECRMNNLLLARPTVESGWLVFEVEPIQLAVGDNLIGLRLLRTIEGEELIVDRVELQVRYQ